MEIRSPGFDRIQKSTRTTKNEKNIPAKIATTVSKQSTLSEDLKIEEFDLGEVTLNNVDVKHSFENGGIINEEIPATIQYDDNQQKNGHDHSFELGDFDDLHNGISNGIMEKPKQFPVNSSECSIHLLSRFTKTIINILNINLDFTRNINGLSETSSLSSKIGWNLGFTRPIYEGNRTYTADAIIEPATIRYIYLAVDDFNNSANNHFITAFNQSILNPNILARFSLRGNYFGILMDNDLNILTEPRKYFGPVDIQRLRIRLYDDFGRILDMNNSNFSFCLVFTILYDL
jgi:hypothetical protein